MHSPLLSSKDALTCRRESDWTDKRTGGMRGSGIRRARRCAPPADSELQPQSSRNAAGNLGRRLVRYREHRTDVYLAKHVAVAPVRGARSKHEVRIPDHRQVTPRDVQQGDQLRRPFVFHQTAQALEAWISIGSVEPWSGLGARGR